MGWSGLLDQKHCRWCGLPYHARQPRYKDGFCKPAHKMAHARAYKKYVTRKSRAKPGLADLRVTQKKTRKRGGKRGKVKRK